MLGCITFYGQLELFPGVSDCQAPKTRSAKNNVLKVFHTKRSPFQSPLLPDYKWQHTILSLPWIRTLTSILPQSTSKSKSATAKALSIKSNGLNTCTTINQHHKQQPWNQLDGDIIGQRTLFSATKQNWCQNINAQPFEKQFVKITLISAEIWVMADCKLNSIRAESPYTTFHTLLCPTCNTTWPIRPVHVLICADDTFSAKIVIWTSVWKITCFIILELLYIKSTL